MQRVIQWVNHRAGIRAQEGPEPKTDRHPDNQHGRRKALAGLLHEGVLVFVQPHQRPDAAGSEGQQRQVQRGGSQFLFEGSDGRHCLKLHVLQTIAPRYRTDVRRPFR
ncbi:hypothetical protein D3C85_1488450 [compost metagenome]